MSVVKLPSMVSVNTMSVNSVFFETSTAYESIPELSELAAHVSVKGDAFVSWPSAGRRKVTGWTDVSVMK